MKQYSWRVHIVNNWRTTCPPDSGGMRVVSFAPFNIWASWGGSVVAFSLGMAMFNLGVELIAWRQR